MKARNPRCTTHFHACDCREAAHAAQVKKLEQERDEAQGKRGVGQRDFYACGEACKMLPHETILGSVLRVVKERDELLAMVLAHEARGSWIEESPRS